MHEKPADRPGGEPEDEHDGTDADPAEHDGTDVEAVERGNEDGKGSLSEEIQRAPAREEESPEG